MIHVRDMISIRDNPVKDISQLKRDILIVPEGVPISHLVQKMRSQRTHMAVVADEFGGTAGLVTIEDLLEELVGEIYDEFDREQPHVKKVNDTDYEVNGRVLLENISEILKVNLEEEGITTIGGYIFTRLSRKPRKGDEVEFDGYTFQAAEVVGSRILKVKIVKKNNIDMVN